ncbi:hypothetical protein [Moheibacter sediminis]|uniref:Lipoprotein n=1 Tax=Moheibacter sediminis TaxID=1434700 RepID=A0A1W2BUB8_9FLAO|nr:hypothetical protein [Moheibacter sediminis]SMC76499.1 hypothetical protein SAMN06296427_107148 [Moheibacter sediminis]
MKKLTFILLAVAGSMAFVGCSSDDDKGTALDCYNQAQKIMDTGAAYSANDSDANCIAFRDALKAAIDASCPGSSVYQSQLEALPCN